MPFSPEIFEKNLLESVIAAQGLNTTDGDLVIIDILNHPSFQEYYALLNLEEGSVYGLGEEDTEFLEFLRTLILEDCADEYGEIFEQDFAAAIAYMRGLPQEHALTLDKNTEINRPDFYEQQLLLQIIRQIFPESDQEDHMASEDPTKIVLDVLAQPYFSQYFLARKNNDMLQSYDVITKLQQDIPHFTRKHFQAALLIAKKLSRG